MFNAFNHRQEHVKRLIQLRAHTNNYRKKRLLKVTVSLWTILLEHLKQDPSIDLLQKIEKHIILDSVSVNT